jgi:hypothetical protein
MLKICFTLGCGSPTGQNDEIAQYNIGMLYENGHGVARDSAEARSWMLKAAANGDGDARAWLATH